MPPSQGNWTPVPPISGALTYAHKQQPNVARWSNYVRITLFMVHCVCSHRLNLTNADAWSVCFANLPVTNRFDSPISVNAKQVRLESIGLVFACFFERSVNSTSDVDILGSSKWPLSSATLTYTNFLSIALVVRDILICASLYKLFSLHETFC